MKKIWSLFVAFAMVFSLAACGGRSVNDTADIDKTEAVAPVEAPDTATEDTLPNEESQIDSSSGDITVSTPADDKLNKEMIEESEAPQQDSSTSDIYYGWAGKVDEDEELDAATQQALIDQACQDLIAQGKHIYDYGYSYFADDTGRELSREEYDTWIAAGYVNGQDLYLDSEHFAGLY